MEPENSVPEAGEKLASYNSPSVSLSFQIKGKGMVVREPCAYQTEAIFNLIGDVLLANGIKAAKLLFVIYEQLASAEEGEDGEVERKTMEEVLKHLLDLDWSPLIGALKDLLGPHLSEIVGLAMACPENAQALEVPVTETIFGVTILEDKALGQFRIAAKGLKPLQQIEVLEKFFEVAPTKELMGNLQRLLIMVYGAISGQTDQTNSDSMPSTPA